MFQKEFSLFFMGVAEVRKSTYIMLFDVNYYSYVNYRCYFDNICNVMRYLIHNLILNKIFLT